MTITLPYHPGDKPPRPIEQEPKMTNAQIGLLANSAQCLSQYVRAQPDLITEPDLKQKLDDWCTDTEILAEFTKILILDVTSQQLRSAAARTPLAFYTPDPSMKGTEPCQIKTNFQPQPSNE